MPKTARTAPADQTHTLAPVRNPRRILVWAVVGVLLAVAAWCCRPMFVAWAPGARPRHTPPPHPAVFPGAVERRLRVPFKLPPVHPLPEVPTNEADPTKREAVREALQQSWDAYVRHAWGYDEYHPLSQHGSNLLGEGRPLGFMIVDALDMLILTHEREAYERARDWVHDTLDWSIDGRLNVFETTIRVLGGLLSAAALRADPPAGALPRSLEDAALFREKAVALAERLRPAFATPTGIPLREINLATGEAFPDGDNYNASSLAEATTIQLEFKYLAHLTGDKTYWDLAERPMHYARAMSQPPNLGILPIFLSPEHGGFYHADIRLGSRGDSYYEYLVKQYMQTNRTEPVYRAMYEQAFDGIKSTLLGLGTHTRPPLVHTLELIPQQGAHGVQWHKLPKQDHLVCFLGGTMLLGAAATLPAPLGPPRTARNASRAALEDWRVGHEVTRACVDTYERAHTGLGAEIVYYLPPEFADLDARDWLVKRYVRGAPRTYAGPTTAVRLRSTRATSCALRRWSRCTLLTSSPATLCTAPGAGPFSRPFVPTPKWTVAAGDMRALTTWTAPTRARSTAWRRSGSRRRSSTSICFSRPATPSRSTDGCSTPRPTRSRSLPRRTRRRLFSHHLGSRTSPHECRG